MESRLLDAGIAAVALAERHAVAPPAAAPAPKEISLPPAVQEAPEASWSDDAAESEFLSEARARGEAPAKAAAANETIEETADPKSLPPLNDLVERIPAEVRETLDELFRAKFVTVRRLPKRALEKT